MSTKENQYSSVQSVETFSPTNSRVYNNVLTKVNFTKQISIVGIQLVAHFWPKMWK